jgi:hypothetical protein
MPEPVDSPRITKQEEREWRAEFERMGRQAVRDAMYIRPGVNPQRKYDLAQRWLREKEIEQERRNRRLFAYAKWTWDAAFAAAVLAAAGIFVAAMALPPERINFITKLLGEGVEGTRRLLHR